MPAAIPVTFRLIVHDAFAARAPPLRVMEEEPAAAVAVPPHELVRPLGVETCKPAGKLSVNAIPLSPSDVFGLLMLKVSEVLAFNRMLAAPNALVMVGG